MKKTLIFLAMAALALTGAAQDKKVMPRYNRGVGPAINVPIEQNYGTDLRVLPENAQTFINTLFPDVAVADVERDGRDQEYEVRMDNGYEVTFDLDGNWLEVDSPDNAMLSGEMVRQLVPENEVMATLSGDAIVNGGVVNYVEDIEVIPGVGYVVEYEVSPAVKGKAGIDNAGTLRSAREMKGTVKKAKYAKVGQGKRHEDKACRAKGSGKAMRHAR